VLGDAVELFEHRQIAVALDIAHRTGVAIPVPGATKVAATLDNSNVGIASLLEPSTHQQATEAAADHGNLYLIGEGLSLDAFAIRVIDEGGKVLNYLDVLLVGILAETPIAFLAILLPQFGRTKTKLLSWVTFEHFDSHVGGLLMQGQQDRTGQDRTAEGTKLVRGPKNLGSTNPQNMRESHPSTWCDHARPWTRHIDAELALSLLAVLVATLQLSSDA
jgi:hypothetical protein